jgi:D-3-phosphoglycerate dehydrogenase
MVVEKKWTRVVGKDVYGKTIGIIGVGNIGKEVAIRARGFGMQLLGNDIVFDYSFAERAGLTYVNLDELMARSDFITMHVPYYNKTHHLVGEKELALIKSTAFFINTARGGVVDEVALYNALLEKRLAGAALDVMENEPDFTNPLLELESVIWTPHVAGITDESRIACLNGACQNSWAVLSGEGEYHQVRPGSIG